MKAKNIHEMTSEELTKKLAELKDELFKVAPIVLVKVSPMADIKLNLSLLPQTSQIHIVSVDNECKELLFLLFFFGFGQPNGQRIITPSFFTHFYHSFRNNSGFGLPPETPLWGWGMWTADSRALCLPLPEEGKSPLESPSAVSAQSALKAPSYAPAGVSPASPEKPRKSPHGREFCGSSNAENQECKIAKSSCAYTLTSFLR